MHASLSSKILTCVFAAIVLFAWAPAGLAQEAAPAGTRLELKVDGVAREALVFAPAAAKDKAAPVVFAFHGHGGTAGHAARTMAFQKPWPEAIIVYPQGLKTAGQLTDREGGKPGWQFSAGMNGDRDFKFFDALLAKLRADYKVDLKRVYATGHSNGGQFTYLLWAERGSVLAAVAPSASVSGPAAAKLKPKPVLHLAGKADPLVRFDWQEKMMKAVRLINGCGEESREWAKDCVIYPSKAGTPLVAYIHSGGHEFTASSAELIVKFFKEYPGEAKSDPSLRCEKRRVGQSIGGETGGKMFLQKWRSSVPRGFGVLKLASAFKTSAALLARSLAVTSVRAASSKLSQASAQSLAASRLRLLLSKPSILPDKTTGSRFVPLTRERFCGCAATPAHLPQSPQTGWSRVRAPR